MNNYLGEFPVDIGKTEFAKYTEVDWALYYIDCYGNIDGDHHKKWVIDQCRRILRGTSIIVVEARWGTSDNITEREYRVNTGEPTQEYWNWVNEYREKDEDGEYYEDDEDFFGIAP